MLHFIFPSSVKAFAVDAVAVVVSAGYMGWFLLGNIQYRNVSISERGFFILSISRFGENDKIPFQSQSKIKRMRTREVYILIHFGGVLYSISW
jgi:hypothetical protein